MKKQRLLRTGCESGFTLIELLVVIVVLGLLAGMIAPKIMGRTDDAKIVKAKGDIKGLETALDMYKLDNGHYPDTEQGLVALVEKPETGKVPKNWRKGGYLKKGKIPKDPWHTEYVYISPGTHGDYDIISYGGDSIQGGEGTDADINNWEID